MGLRPSRSRLDADGRDWPSGTSLEVVMSACLRPAHLRTLVLAMTLLAAAAAVAAPPSLLEVPIEVDLRPLFRAADEQLPREAGHWKGWRDWHGIQTRYRAWRGPLSLTMTGDLLQAQAHVRYWARARKHVIGGFDLNAGCGVDEPPRQALIGLVARLGFAPDWTLRPSFRVLPPRFLDGCEVTVLGIDVSPILGEVFEDQLEATLRRAMDDLRPRLAEVQGQAVRLWAALQDPMEIAPGLWLTASPLGVALAPPMGRGDRLHTALGLALELRLDAGEAKVAAKRPLPPLQPFLPRGEGVHFDLTLAVDYGALGDALGRQIAGPSFEIQGQEVQVQGVEVGAKAGDLVVRARLAGAAPGVLTIMARPAWGPVGDGEEGDSAGEVRLADLGFVFEAEDPDQGLAVDLFYERIRSALDRAANDLLKARAGLIREGLQAALSRILAEALPGGTGAVAGIDLSGVGLRDLTIEVGDAGLRLRGSAAGRISVGGRSSAGGMTGG
jgi:hypothetical protein